MNIRKVLQSVVLLGFVSASWAGAYEDYFKAVELDDSRTVSRLLARGFDPNTPDPNGQVGLFLALRGGSTEVAQVLLAHPELRPDARNPHDETPLMMAALKGVVPAMQALISRGAQVDKPGWTPLHYAASGSSLPALRLLLDRGATVDARSPNGSTPLMLAAQYGSEEAVELLLARGADPAARNQRELGPADFARNAGRESLVRRLEARR